MIFFLNRIVNIYLTRSKTGFLWRQKKEEKHLFSTQCRRYKTRDSREIIIENPKKSVRVNQNLSKLTMSHILYI